MFVCRYASCDMIKLELCIVFRVAHIIKKGEYTNIYYINVNSF